MTSQDLIDFMQMPIVFIACLTMGGIAIRNGIVGLWSASILSRSKGYYKSLPMAKSAAFNLVIGQMIIICTLLTSFT